MCKACEKLKTKQRCKKCKKAYDLPWDAWVKKKSSQIKGSLKSRGSKYNRQAPSLIEIRTWLTSYNDNFFDYYTKDPISRTEISVDHKYPLVRGGSNLIYNLAICSKATNEAKGNLREEEFRDLLNLKWEEAVLLSTLARLRRGNKYK
jgi:5-methylcytosine-specific restriction endonuclease McrA